MPVPDFSPGEILTAAAMDSIGLWKVTTQTVTNQSTLSINNCFSTDFDNYRVIFTLTAVSANVNFYWRLRANGTDNSTNYYWGALAVDTQGGSAVNANSPRPAAEVNPSFVSTSLPQGMSTIELNRVNDAVPTAFTFVENFNDTNDQRTRSGGGIHLLANAYDGITFGVAGGATMSGIARVYGYRD